MEFTKISLDGWVKKGEGATAVVYADPKNDGALLKLFSPQVNLTAALDEYNKSVTVSKLGLPTPKALDFVTFNNQYGILYEKVKNKRSISRAVADDYEHVEKYMTIFASMCKLLHETECQIEGIRPMKEDIRHAIEVFDQLDEKRKAKVSEFFENTFSDAKTCLHCDMHIGNVVLSGETPYWIDLGGFSYGDPYFDVATFYLFTNVFCNTGYIQDIFHLNEEQLKTCWKYFAKHYFEGKTEAQILEKEALLRKYCVLYMIYYVVIIGFKSPTFDEDFAFAMKAFD